MCSRKRLTFIKDFINNESVCHFMVVRIWFSLCILQCIFIKFVYLFSKILHLLQLLEDPLQQKRLQCVVDGTEEEDGTSYDGLLGKI